MYNSSTIINVFFNYGDWTSLLFKSETLNESDWSTMIKIYMQENLISAMDCLIHHVWNTPTKSKGRIKHTHTELECVMQAKSTFPSLESLSIVSYKYSAWLCKLFIRKIRNSKLGSWNLEARGETESIDVSLLLFDRSHIICIPLTSCHLYFLHA